MSSLCARRFTQGQISDQILKDTMSDPVVNQTGLLIYAKEVDTCMSLVAYRHDGCYVFFRNGSGISMRVSETPDSGINTNIQAFLYAYESTFTTLVLDQGTQFAFAPYARFEDASIIGTVYGILDYCLTKVTNVITYEKLRVTVLGSSPDHEQSLRTIIFSVVQALMDSSANKDCLRKRGFLSRIDLQVGDNPLVCRLQNVCDEILVPQIDVSNSQLVF